MENRRGIGMRGDWGFPGSTTTLSKVRTMNANRTHLQLDADRTVLSPPDSTQVAIAVGIDRLANEVFLHDPPSAVELERGITVIEDALMDAGLSHHAPGELATSDTHLQRLVGPMAGSTPVPLAEVEALFQRMAAISHGSLTRSSDPVFTRRASAALLILREIMHHLGYSAVQVDAQAVAGGRPLT